MVTAFRKYSTSAVTGGSAPFVLCNVLTPTDEDRLRLGRKVLFAKRQQLVSSLKLNVPVTK